MRDLRVASLRPTLIFGTALASLAPAVASAQVGVDGLPGNCFIGSIQAAVAFAPPGGRLILQEGFTFRETVVINKDISIVTGDGNCQYTAFPTPAFLLPPLAGGRPMTIQSGRNVILQNFVIEGGNAGQGGNIFADFDAHVSLPQMEIRGGQAMFGGGVYSNGAHIELGLGTEIKENVADLDGGGIYAVFGSVSSPGSTWMYLNRASRNGGAIFATEGATVFLESTHLQLNIADDHGGGVYIETGELTVGRFCILQDNRATLDGAGVHAAECEFTLDDRTEFFDNQAQNNGGAIHLVDVAVLSPLDSWFHNNEAFDDGAAIYLENVSAGVVIDGTFEENISSRAGGGVYAIDSPGLSIKGIFEGNIAFDYGGAIAVSSSGPLYTVTLDAPKLLSNEAFDHGGGLAVLGAVAVSAAAGTEISGNTANAAGGGVFVQRGQFTAASGLVLSGNTAAVGGGLAMWCEGGNALASISFTSVTDNYASSGGGAFDAENLGNLNCTLALRAVEVADNRGELVGGGALIKGRTTATFSEVLFHNNSSNRGGGLAVTTNDAAGRPTVTVNSPVPNGNQPCRSSGVPPANEYCAEFRNNSADIEGGAVYVTEGVLTIDKVAFIDNSTPGHGSAIMMHIFAVQGEIAASNLLLVQHTQAVPTEVVYAEGSARFDMWSSTIADNDGAAINWAAGSSGSLYHSAIADDPIIIDPLIASIAGDCNAVVNPTSRLGGINEIGMSNAQFAPNARSDYEVDNTSTLLFEKCPTVAGAPQRDIDNVRRSDLNNKQERGAFDDEN